MSEIEEPGDEEIVYAMIELLNETIETKANTELQLELGGAQMGDKIVIEIKYIRNKQTSTILN